MTRAIIRYGLLLALVWIVIAPSQAEAHSLTGKWVVTVESPQGPNDMNMTLTMAGAKLTGEISSPMGSMKIEGGIDEEGNITFEFTFEQQGEKILISFRGYSDEDVEYLEGEVDFGGFASGYWSAVRE